VALGAWAIVLMAPRGIPVAAVLAGAGIAGALVARSKSSKHYEQVTSFWGIVLNGVALVVTGIRGLGWF
jgi:hypothetical protein